MATATIAPVATPAGDSRIHNAWMWMRELMKKAAKGFSSGATKVRITLMRAAASTAAGVIAAGTQIGLATRAGWDGAARAATGALGLVAKGAIQVARGASWIVDKIGKGFGWLVGLFSKKAGAAVANGNERFTNWRQEMLGSARSKVDGVAFFARAAVTSPMASTVGRSTAGVLGLAGAANIATRGGVAAKVMSFIGPKAALLFGPASLLITGVVGVLGGLFSWLFRRNEVMTKAAEMLSIPPQPTPMAQSTPVPATPTDITVDFTDEGGAVITGSAEHVAAAVAPENLAQTLDNAKASQLMGMGMLPVTNQMVEASLRQTGAQPMANGKFAKAAMDKRRKALREGHIELPVMPEAAEAVSA